MPPVGEVDLVEHLVCFKHEILKNTQIKFLTAIVCSYNYFGRAVAVRIALYSRKFESVGHLNT